MAESEPQHNTQQCQPPAEQTDSSFFSWLPFTSSRVEPPEQPEQHQEEAPQTSSWFSWPWSSGPAEPESESEDNDAAELLRSARTAVDTAKDSVHYALMFSPTDSDPLLAVSSGPTESNPVHCPSKKIPSLPAEILEKAFIKPLAPPPAPAPPPAEPPTDDAVEKAAGPSKNPTLPPGEPLVLPSLDQNLRTITLVTKMRLYGERVIYGEGTSEKHLYKSTPKSISSKRSKQYRKITVVSVHSFLPQKFVKSYISQNTGTARLMGKNTAEAVKGWFEKNNEYHGPTEITTICLEGHGTIKERVAESRKLLKNWARVLNESHAIFFVANSVAVPATVVLISELLQDHSLHLKKKRIGFIALTGVNSGVFPGLETKVVVRAYTQTENEIIKEMFELRKLKSDTTRRFLLSLDAICQANVKVSLFGSLTDQLIPLYSSVSSVLRHPNIYKSIYVEPKADVPPFITKLLSTIMIMQNMGYSDQSVVRDLSEYLQGPVNYISGTHGKTIHEAEVYEIGVRFAMETTKLVQHRQVARDRVSLESDYDKNLFHIPWNVRGLVNELLHIKNIANLDLLNELVKAYKTWEPRNKVWREVKLSFAAFEEMCLDELIP